MINILIVDDSLVVREHLKYIFRSDPEINIMATVASGEEALNFLETQKPDLITMDIHMSGWDGFETTQKIMAAHPVAIIIVTGDVTFEHGKNLFRAIEAGALTIVEKPPGLGNPDFYEKAAKLIQMAKTMSEVKVVRRRPFLKQDKKPLQLESSRNSQNSQNGSDRVTGLKVVAIGVSTGGPLVIQSILSVLPKGFPVPIIIVQHIMAGFLSTMVDWLRQSSQLTINIPEHGTRLLPGNVYLAPEDLQMAVTPDFYVKLTHDKPENSSRPSVSYLFRSVLKAFGSEAVGILLTGMGSDGADELLKMKQRGALTIVQDKESSVVFGMPQAAIQLGAETYVLSPAKICEKLIEISNVRVV